MKQTLAKIGNALAQSLTRERVCEACGKEFSCGASLSGCWCSEINLTDETRADLKLRYRDCLCRECLSSHSSDGG
jgi:Cysteine-rich CWC